MLDVLSNNFVGVHELRKNLPALLTSVQEEGFDLVITHQGKPVAILMNLTKYLETQEALRELADPTYLAGLLAARQEIREGKGIPAEKVFAKKGL